MVHNVEEEIAQAMEKSKKEFSKETLDKLTLLLKRVDEKCPPKPRVLLKPVRAENISVFDSKLGGVPYLPKEMEYPKVLEGSSAGKPLRLLAQLNFEKLPRLEGFPEKGILQFFTGSDDDDVIGIDFDNYFNQNAFRVIYHKNITEDTSKLISQADMPDFDCEEDYFPFKGEFLLTAGEVRNVPVTTADFRFDIVIAEAYNELFGGNIVGVVDYNRVSLAPAYKSHDLRVSGFARYNYEISQRTLLGNYFLRAFDEAACAVDNFDIAPRALAVIAFGHSVRAEHHRASVGYLVEAFYNIEPLIFYRLDNLGIMNNFAEYIGVFFFKTQRGIYGVLNALAKPAVLRNVNFHNYLDFLRFLDVSSVSSACSSNILFLSASSHTAISSSVSLLS